MRTFVFYFASCCVVGVAAGGEAAVHIAPLGGDAVRVTVSTTPAEVRPDGAMDAAAGRRLLTFGIVDEATNKIVSPMHGTYAIVGAKLQFTPAFALVRGSTYRAESTGGATADYRAPPLTDVEPATVTEISPAADRLPANVLRFYVTFSRPMREGREVLERIHLLDDAGKELVSPWRDLELWNDDATRLTLFLHPGRIKQGVNLRVELGPLLEPGRKYTLVVGGDLLDARGVPLGRATRKTFTTTDELRARIDVAAWRLSTPAAGSRAPVAVEFGRTVDAALARRCVRVVDAAGNETPGTIDVAPSGERWSFTPDAPWSAETYMLDVDRVLEDVCGNSPVRAFDVDLEAQPVEVLPPTLRREFAPR